MELPLLVVLFVVISRHFSYTNQHEACDSNLTEHDGSCYHFSQTKSDFTTSKSSCESLGMHLVYIESRPEKEFLVDNTQHNDGSWIGLSGFSWLDGSGLTYSNFGGSSAFNEKSLCFRIQEWNFRWNDRSCSTMFSFVCEKQGACDDPTDTEHEGSCYHVSQSQSNFSTSKSSCEDLGMHLVYIESQQEQDFLADHLVENEDYWMGLSHMTWRDGSIATYNNIPIENHEFNDGTSCFQMAWSFGWEDISCINMHYYICEKEGVCGSDHITYGGSCYRFHVTKPSFSSAKSACETDPGWHLVYIGSHEEQDFLERNIPNQEEGYWIGLSSVTWLDGSQLTYNNFGGPYISAFNSEAIAFFLKKYSRAWYDDTYDSTFRYICEKEGGCTESLVENNGSCYFISVDTNHFFPSKTDCETRGMHLVYIGSQEEQDFLVSHLVDTEEYWIGLSSLVWQDGSHLVYNNILYHDYAFDDEGSCFRMYPSDLLWYSKSCSDSYHYICEKEIEQATTDDGPVTTAQSMSDQAHKRSMSIKLLAANSVLNKAHVLTSYTASSLTRCAKQCLAKEMCSCFTFIEHERACLLGAACQAEYALNYDSNPGTKTYSKV